jgi:hypothetical protein
MRISLGESAILRRDEEMWRWKHETSPFGPSHVLVAEDGSGQVIGLRAFLKWEFERQGELVKAVRAVDTATHPGFRRLGLFSNLTKQAVADMRADGVHMVFNTPNDKSRPGYLKLGWQYVGLVEPVVRVLNYPRFAAGLARWFVLRRRPDKAEGDVFGRDGPVPVSVLTDHPGLDALIEQDSAIWGGMLHTRRSRAYLKWRYAAHPAIPYRAETLIRGGRLEAAAIVRSNPRFGLREAVIAELLLSNPDPALAKELFASLREKLNADYMIGYFPDGSAHRDALSRSRFRRARGQGMTLTRNPLTAVFPELSGVGQWGLALGDLELF